MGSSSHISSKDFHSLNPNPFWHINKNLVHAVRFQSSCTIDVTYFPFDQQTCIMKFGSWTFNGDQVSLALYNNKNYVDLSDYWKSGTWDIIEVPAYLNIYEGNHPTETDITFYIIIRRKTLFYTVNLILPTVLISFLCVLVFYLPAEAGEKVMPKAPDREISIFLNRLLTGDIGN